MFDQTEAVDLLSYAFRVSFPQMKLVVPRSPQWLLDHIADLGAVVTSFRLYGGVDGFLLTQQLRSMGFSQPIVMLSNSDELAATAALHGLDEFLPFERWSEIPSRVAALLAPSLMH